MGRIRLNIGVHEFPTAAEFPVESSGLGIVEESLDGENLGIIFGPEAARAAEIGNP
ncbi:MAG: hypothetical protein DDT28_00186 [Dehalococcoidia bacterium]|nr:hypothetical protein [Chloroflexota bacterium]